MEYLSDRMASLNAEAENLDFNKAQKEFMDRLMQFMAEMAVMVDDTVDAIDELDMRLLELEQKGE